MRVDVELGSTRLLMPVEFNYFQSSVYDMPNFQKNCSTKANLHPKFPACWLQIEA